MATERTHKRARWSMTVKVSVLRRHAAGESRRSIAADLGIGSLSTIGRWFSEPRVLRAAGLGRAQCADIGVEYLGPYEAADVLPDPDGHPYLGDDAPIPERLSPVKPIKADAKPGAGSGRPSALENPAVVAKLKKGLRLMLPTRFLADYVGVTQQTITGWIRDADAGKDTPGGRLGTIIKEARAEGIVNAHEEILNGGMGAKGAQFLLARVHKLEYAERIEQSVENQDPMAELEEGELDEMIRSGEGED